MINHNEGFYIYIIFNMLLLLLLGYFFINRKYPLKKANTFYTFKNLSNILI